MIPTVRPQPSPRPRIRKAYVDESHIGSLITGAAFLFLGLAAVIYFVANAAP